MYEDDAKTAYYFTYAYIRSHFKHKLYLKLNVDRAPSIESVPDTKIASSSATLCIALEYLDRIDVPSHGLLAKPGNHLMHT